MCHLAKCSTARPHTEKILTLPPTGGAVFAFRGRRGDRLKLLYFDGQGFCLFKSLSPCIRRLL
ncbi:IS66 family insertion sequence element accessory protein TnpB [Mesorhizobium sp. M0220]|uniref:IS66 family insertion sequence element accessory protein TnpB n=1 Tax=Mesorhizobium sp. M0220 TaxID=2956920 RepID=UPI003338A2C7